LVLLAMVPDLGGSSSAHLAAEDTGKVQEGGFGDCIEKKDKDVVRIGFLNVGGLSPQNNTFKEEALRIGITSYEFDVFGMAEMNVDWRLSKESERLYTRTRDW
jgi:hypothetical protein